MEYSKLKDYVLIRYAILFLILFYFPAFTLVYINGALSSLLSYASYGLILLYVALCGKTGNCNEMLLMGGIYYLISGFVSQDYMVDIYSFLVIIIKYFIIIWGGYEVMKRTTAKEIWIFLVIGILSILGNIFLFPNPEGDYGRFSGFYLDPNNAGMVCLFGFALSYSMPKKLVLFGKLFFTILGLLTFSRTFIIIWVLLNLISIKLDVKNAKMLLLGFGSLALLVAFNDFLPVQSPRLEQMAALVSGENVTQIDGIDEDSRTETWARYYDALFTKPFFGNGYGAFLGNGVAPTQWGVHNTYLRIWGEGGIIPLLIFLAFLWKLFVRSWTRFKEQPHLFLILANLSIFLLTLHDFMITEYALFILMWTAIQVNKKEAEFITANSESSAT
jgi:O-antigen ligase